MPGDLSLENVDFRIKKWELFLILSQILQGLQGTNKYGAPLTSVLVFSSDITTILL